MWKGSASNLGESFLMCLRIARSRTEESDPLRLQTGAEIDTCRFFVPGIESQTRLNNTNAMIVQIRSIVKASYCCIVLHMTICVIIQKRHFKLHSVLRLVRHDYVKKAVGRATRLELGSIGRPCNKRWTHCIALLTGTQLRAKLQTLAVCYTAEMDRENHLDKVITHGEMPRTHTI